MGSSLSSFDNNRHLYFDPDVDSPEKKTDYFTTNCELNQLLREVVDASEKITEVKYYSYSLHSWILSKYFTTHAFIVLKTDNCWWSIEKDQRGITIQRSKFLENVRDKCRRHGRIEALDGIKMLKKDRGNFTLNGLVLYMWRKDHMNLNYHFLDNNGQTFADVIFELFYSKPICWICKCLLYFESSLSMLNTRNEWLKQIPSLVLFMGLILSHRKWLGWSCLLDLSFLMKM
jgi:hypothetical protein